MFPNLRFAVMTATLLVSVHAFAGSPSSLAPSAVLDAIKSFEGNLPTNVAIPGKTAKASTDALAKAANVIVKFAIDSDQVVIDMGPDAVTWCDVKRGVNGMANSGERGLIFAAYLSGEIKAQLSTQQHDPNPYAGWVSALRLYKALKVRDNLKIAELDVLAAKQQDASLEAFAADAAKRSIARLDANYHGERPVTLAFSR